MNRPKEEDYPIYKYIHLLELYCDKLEDALDNACYYLWDRDEHEDLNPQEWKGRCLKDE